MRSQPFPLTTKNLLRYSVFALPLAFAGLPIYLLAPDFYAVNKGVSLGALGAVLLALRVLDAGLDPFIGRMSDRITSLYPLTNSIALLLLVAGIGALFVVPEMQTFATLLWFGSAIFITSFAYSFLTINFGAAGARWSHERQPQVRITTAREAFGLVSIILAVTLPFVLQNWFEINQAMLIYVLVLSLIALVCLTFYWPATSLLTEATAATATQKVLPKLRYHPQLTPLYLVYGISMFASAIPGVLVLFFVRDYLGAENLSGFYLLLYLLSGVLFMPFWRWLANRVGNLRAWQFSMALAVLCFLWVMLLQPGDLVAYGVICLLTGVALGAELALPPAILATLIEENDASAALKYSGLTALNKLTLALATGISLPLLSLAGFTPAAENASDAQFALLIAYGAAPCVIKILSLTAAEWWRRSGMMSYEN